MFRIIPFIILLIIFSPNVFSQDCQGIELIELAPNESTNEKSILGDIIRCSKEPPFTQAHGRTTQAHETVHGINSYIRNNLKKKGRKKVNALYAGSNNIALVDDPLIKIRQVTNFVPNALRGKRYKLYFIEQAQYWDDVPTYLMDEWSAYIAGAECGVDDFEKGLPKENSDVVSGALEFSIYCTSFCLAVKHHDPEYWHSNKRFRCSIKYFLIKSEKIFFKGYKIFKNDEQENLLDALRNHKDAKELRDLIVEEFDSIFIN